MSVDTYFCFCCLSTSDLFNLFSAETDDNYAEMLKDLYSIEISKEEYEYDGYICHECADKLRNILKHKLQVFQILQVLEGNGLINITKTKDNAVFVSKAAEDLMNEDDTNKWQLRMQADQEIVEFLGLNTFDDFKNEELSAPKNQTVEITQKQSENLEPVTLRSEKKITVSKKKVKEKVPEKSPPVVYQVTDDFKCKYCEEVLPNAKVFHSHMNKHFPNHICDTCGKGYLSAKRLKRHLPSHDTGPFTCAPPCGAVFTNYNTFCSHRQRKHTSGLLYACPHCRARFRTYTRRAQHLAGAHAQREPRYRCALCDARFLISANLNSHLRNTHLKVARHACAECGAAFLHKRELRAHVSRHSGVNMYQCGHCAKSYTRRNALVVHTRTHTGEKPFHCTKCGKEFNQKCTLLKHYKCHAKYDQADLNTGQTEQEPNMANDGSQIGQNNKAGQTKVKRRKILINKTQSVDVKNSLVVPGTVFVQIGKDMLAPF